MGNENFFDSTLSNSWRTNNNIYMLCIPQIVSVRTYSVDITQLKQILISCKRESGISNNSISRILNKPITLVEHWFRSDDCFSIPDADIWYQLKDILNIETDEFDQSITQFTYKFGSYEKSERCYFDFGIAPTLTTVNTDEKIILTEFIF